MFKTLWLSICGWFRKQAANNTDMNNVAFEKGQRLQNGLANAISARQRIAAMGKDVEYKLRTAAEQVELLQAEIVDADKRGDYDTRDRAYTIFTKRSEEVTDLKDQEASIKKQLEQMDSRIDTLEREIDEAKLKMAKLAADQQYGNAIDQVEKVHDSLGAGDLSAVEQTVNDKIHLSDAKREYRENNDTDKFLKNIGREKPKSLEDILAGK